MYYGVELKNGYQTVLNTWDECKELIDLFLEGARYKKFASYEEALAFAQRRELNNPKDKLCLATLPMSKEFEDFHKYVNHSLAYVYGNFNFKKEIWGYAVILFLSPNPADYVYFTRIGDKYLQSKKIAGDVFGALRAIKEATLRGKSRIMVCYDYDGIENWATGAYKKIGFIGSRYSDTIREYSKSIDIAFQKIKFSKNNINDDNIFMYKVYKLSREVLGLR